MWLRALKLAAIAAALIGLIAVKAPICPFAAFTGHPCPGCGLTRATLAALSGDLGRSFALQPYAMFASPLLGAFTLAVATRYVIAGKISIGPYAERNLIPAAGALFLAMIWFWFARFLGVWGGPVPV